MSSQTATASIHQPVITRTTEIDFLYIDLTVCDRCVGTGDSLDAAIEIVRPALAATGIEPEVRRTLVESEDQARALGFISSPTIRVNGRDIATVTRETVCGTCGDICGEETTCRVWEYQGHEYTVAPTGAIVEGILRETFAPEQRSDANPAPAGGVPLNLQQFFAGKARPEGTPVACCPPAEAATCCAPEAKADCCGSTHAPGCGCR
jgi:hypothetical protein